MELRYSGEEAKEYRGKELNRRGSEDEKGRQEGSEREEQSGKEERHRGREKGGAGEGG